MRHRVRRRVNHQVANVEHVWLWRLRRPSPGAAQHGAHARRELPLALDAVVAAPEHPALGYERFGRAFAEKIKQSG